MVLETGVTGCEAKLMRCSPEVVNGVLGDLRNDARWESIRIGHQDALRRGHVCGVVPDGSGIRVGESIKLEVGVLGQHNGGLLLERLRVHHNAPLVL